MTESTSHGCFPGTPWGDKKYPCRFTVKNNHSSSRLLSTSCFSAFLFYMFLHSVGAKRRQHFRNKIVSSQAVMHLLFIRRQKQKGATHVWQADVSNNLAPLTDYIWRGEGRAFCNKMPDRIQVKNNEQLGNVETMFFQRRVCGSFLFYV